MLFHGMFFSGSMPNEMSEIQSEVGIAKIKVSHPILANIVSKVIKIEEITVARLQNPNSDIPLLELSKYAEYPPGKPKNFRYHR